jgi:hypothetical protein
MMLGTILFLLYMLRDTEQHMLGLSMYHRSYELLWDLCSTWTMDKPYFSAWLELYHIDTPSPT